ncbi:MAG TPA: tetratricopeptide repeat protein [Chloroflexota bacterium]|nr:tetratricopeptide repeat protein [Chloroflexota bacterium]
MNSIRDGVSDIDSLWDYQDPQGSGDRFRSILPATMAPEHQSYRLELMTQIARTEGLQDRFDEANSILDQVEAELSDEGHRPRIRYLMERGRALNSSGSPEQSRSYFLDAYEIAKGSGEDYLTIDAIHMLAVVESPEKQIEWGLLGLKIAQKTTNKRAADWQGPLYNNLGWTYYDLERYADALPLFQASLAWREEQRDERGTKIAAGALVECLRKLGRSEEAAALEARYGGEDAPESVP